ncbi:MAG: ATP-binding cassette domain-containing protein [Candidatus Eisenbacteria bacterium]|nr:ATP-binding cassette domain-containing protein [Candidatus Eisenbacteria bacterium]
MRPIIQISSLSFAYPDGTSALDGVSLDIFEDECLGLVGPNGAGKTTLLLHLNGILSGSGKVTIDGLEVCDKNLREVRQRVGIVFQDPDDQLFSPTVFDDVAFGPLTMRLANPEVLSRVNWALNEAGLAGLEKKAPHHLSFGQKKKASLASVLSMRPRIIALDEPTSNMDPRSRRRFLQLIKALKATKVLSTHDMESVSELCSRVVVLDSGRVVADGNTQSVLSNRELMESHGLEVPRSLWCPPRHSPDVPH